MKRGFSVAFVLAGCLCAASWSHAHVPGDAAQSGQKPANGTAQPAPTSPANANPFPEDTSSVPVLPTRDTPAAPEWTHNGADSAGVPLPGGDADPARSPDDPAPSASSGQDDESSSSLKGMDRLLPPPDDDQPGRHKKLAVKEPTHQEAASKDIEVGGYYLETRNWKAAHSRFESALILDPENPDVYWGLAEAERHLGDMAAAKTNYLKLLDYDPDGPHGKEARKVLKDPALANAKVAVPVQPAAESPK
jgi:hypothetical protein